MARGVFNSWETLSSEKPGAVFLREEGLALLMMAFQGALPLAQPGGEVAHAECYDDEEDEHDDVLRLADVQGKLRRDEDEIPHQSAEHRHEQDRPAIPHRAGHYYGEEEQQRGKLRACVWQQSPAEGRQGKDDHHRPAILGDAPERFYVLSFQVLEKHNGEGAGECWSG